MTLCWTLDKLGPMTRGVEDAFLVLAAVSGPDPGDLYSVPSHMDFDANRSVKGLRVGYVPAWMKESPATDVDRAALEKTRSLGMVPVEVTLPDWPYNSLNAVLFGEAAAAFEELTLSHGMDQLKMQVPDAWPNLFRQARFVSAVDFVQADRMRRMVARDMARVFENVDVLLTPPLRDEILTITNFTGHPALVLRTGFLQVTQARNDWAPDPREPDADLQDAAARSARRLADRAPLRRRDSRRRRHGPREGVRGRGGEAAGVLIGGALPAAPGASRRRVAPKDNTGPPQRPSSPGPAMGGSCTEEIFISRRRRSS